MIICYSCSRKLIQKPYSFCFCTFEAVYQIKVRKVTEKERGSEAWKTMKGEKKRTHQWPIFAATHLRHPTWPGLEKLDTAWAPTFKQPLRMARWASLLHGGSKTDRSHSGWIPAREHSGRPSRSCQSFHLNVKQRHFHHILFVQITGQL